MLFFITFIYFAYSTDVIDLQSGNGRDCLDILTYEERPCTTMRTGMVRKTNEEDQLQICSNRKWERYNPQGCYYNRVPGLVGHWQMDETSGTNVVDDSGYEHHGTVSSGPVPKPSKFSYGRYFNGNGLITIQGSPDMNFGTSSFSVTGWQKVLNLDYPLTNFAVKKGNGCYYAEDRAGWLPGWEIAHGLKSNSLNVCIRDNNNVKAHEYVLLDLGYEPIDKWVHYAVVYDRENEKKAFVYINGKKQSNSLDISSVVGSVDNNKGLEFGLLYGWKTQGTLDDYRLYNRALDEYEVEAIYHNHLA